MISPILPAQTLSSSTVISILKQARIAPLGQTSTSYPLFPRFNPLLTIALFSPEWPVPILTRAIPMPGITILHLLPTHYHHKPPPPQQQPPTQAFSNQPPPSNLFFSSIFFFFPSFPSSFSFSFFPARPTASQSTTPASPSDKRSFKVN
ncbi:hypothetical protein L873DRAFT_289064 [Choiromyces venosus 120613-1]|uniref:Uncharacterized protein n=1 Tax=Choiromyces venosus 120613-1 TaxID=1336337 RepID=A0A3N4JXW0_9PEZI|nr:hypothetical protein L873DRAFT_289064 [Choiromyces venosus 120613-1]